MEIDRKAFLESLGGPEAISKMDSEERADALEHHMVSQLNQAISGQQGSELEKAK